MNIQEQITLYPELTGEERAAVDAFVSAHPEWESALDEARRWDRLLREVRTLGQDPSGDEALAYYITTRDLQPDRAPSAAADLIRRVEDRIENDPDLAIRVAEMEARMAALQEGLPASEQFDRLLNRARPRAAQPASRSEAALYLWRVAAAIVALVVVYGALYAAGQAFQPSYERLAAFEDRELTLEGYDNVRGEGAAATSNASIRLYLEALEQLRGAETSVLGLFPDFDQARLDSAAVHLDELLGMEPAESFLAGEAAFLLGKTELARGNIDAAEEAFSRVISAGGRRASDARRILLEMRS